jgi:predicted 3-demethylubiquinone-9 3-methyltransferase (glyoxalase superfamily)
MAKKKPAKKAKGTRQILAVKGAAKQKITTFLWYDGKAEAAARFYVSLFKNSKIISTNPMVVRFSLAGQEFLALNGGPQHKFNEAVSLVVDCADQAEVDYFWNKLTADGGQESMCGWLKDKYGLSWQIIPTALPKLIANPRAMQAMLTMRKIDIATLERA